MAPIAKSEASHIISNGMDQSGGVIMGAVVRAVRNVLNAFKQSSSKINGVSLANRLHKSFEILLKSLMKRL